MKVLVSGIGRSGTTTVFKVLGNAFLKQYPAGETIYEPYLWNIKAAYKSADVKGQPFDNNQLNIFGIYTHTKTPIFLDGAHPLHDLLLDKNLAGMLKSEKKDRLLKVIRGAGRLDAVLNKFPDTKVILVTRNIADTVNSGLGLFSFYGDEFHPSDRTRFLHEVNERYSANIRESELDSELKWATIWWRYLTLRSFESARNNTDNIFVLPYELYVKDKYSWIEKLSSYLGLDIDNFDSSLLDQGAGPQTSTTRLSRIDVELMGDDIMLYAKLVNEMMGSPSIPPGQLRKGLIEKYSSKQVVAPIVDIKQSSKTAVNLRLANLNILQSKSSDRPQAQLKTTLKKVLERHAAPSATQSVSIRGERSIAVIITCFNNEETIADAVQSVLDQSHTVDQIIIADDYSKDSSRTILERMSQEYAAVKLVKREYNIGVSANRHLAIQECGTDLITTLDGDDLFFADKIEKEYRVLCEHGFQGVAYSDILLVREGERRLSTAGYHGMTGRDALRNICKRSNPVPRDMLFAKELYLKTGGFDLDLNMYEDWALKMRLCSQLDEASRWLHSGIVGTIYDRRQPGLSGQSVLREVYYQLLVLAMNIPLWITDPEALKGGLIMIFEHSVLEGGGKPNFSGIFSRPASINTLIEALVEFRGYSTLSDDSRLMASQLESFKGKLLDI